MRPSVPREPVFVNLSDSTWAKEAYNTGILAQTFSRDPRYVYSIERLSNDLTLVTYGFALLITAFKTAPSILAPRPRTKNRGRAYPNR